MPRPLRLVLKHECYHVINRSNSGQLIFDSPGSYLEYQALLLRYTNKFSVRIYHYVLMPNHVHLLVEPMKDNLSKFMQAITLSHTRRYNNRQNLHGHLWQGRYKSIHIHKDEYFLQCGRYIERNPVRANLVTEPLEYPWSSYGAYARGLLNPLVTINQFYVDLGKTDQERQLKYQMDCLEQGRPDTKTGI